MMSTSRMMTDSDGRGGLSLVARLRTTPLRDLMRGRLSAQLHYRHLVLASDLPPSIQSCVVSVVRRTRLWRNEKVEVARELIGHFQDGFDAGRSSDELASDFGDPLTAAKLIRRAKKRQRPAWWKAWRLAFRIITAFILLLVITYLYFAVPYWTASPDPKVDYVAQFNAEARASDPADRAWPLYQQASEALPDAKTVGIIMSRPGDENWPGYSALLEENRPTLDVVRQGARKPALGYVAVSPTSDDILDGGYFNVPLEYLSVMRRLAMLLLDDARRLEQSEDTGDAVTDTLIAVLNMAEQTRENEVMICDLVAGAIFNAVIDALNEMLADRPELFTDEHLVTLAHRISAFADGDPTARIGAERRAFADLLQRIYTDDGEGSGHLTMAGGDALISLTDYSGFGLELPEPIGAAFNPFLMAGVADRGEMQAKFDELMGELLSESALPMWRRRETPSAFRTKFDELADSSIQKLRYLPIVLMMPALDHVATANEMVIQRRDAILAVIALELFRRRHGEWPAMLDELSPKLLPSVPFDRYAGTPIQYLVRDGRPVLYSVGSDGEDHGGVPPRDASGTPRLEYARGRFSVSLDHYTKFGVTPGDWILWPPAQMPNSN